MVTEADEVVETTITFYAWEKGPGKAETPGVFGGWQKKNQLGKSEEGSAMGLLDKILGSKEPDHPELEASDQAAQLIERNQAPLKKFADDVPKERLEVVPSESGGYVFLGNPPKQFGLAWIENGTVRNLKDFAESGGLSPTGMENLVGQLTQAYRTHQDKPRYQYHLDDRKVVVTPDAELEQTLRQIIEETNEKIRLKHERAKQQGKE